jgi:hypothetical protein
MREQRRVDPIQDAPAMAKLKRMVLLRIADLEAVDAIQRAVDERNDHLHENTDITRLGDRGSRLGNRHRDFFAYIHMTR